MRDFMSDDDETFRRTPFEQLTYAWHPMNSSDGGEEDSLYSGVSGKPISMMRELVKCLKTSSVSQSLTFRYVNGPDILDEVYRKGMPIIPAGLYHGCYNALYGKFRREVIIVSYKKYLWTNVKERKECMLRIRDEVFSNGVDQTDNANLFSRILLYLNSDKGHAIFLLGRKVTGDYHVTCDRLTFCALVSPQIGDDNEFSDMTKIRDRGDDGCGQTYPVLRRFFGFGTLAFPGFVRPSWDEGRLAQIRSKEEDEDVDPSFAFVFGRNARSGGGGDGVMDGIVLRWIKDQDLYPFFSKSRRRC